MNPVWHIILDGDGAFQDLRDLFGEPIDVADGETRVALLPGGMASGAPSIAFAFVLPNERWVFAQTSLKMFLTAADAFKARAGDPR